MKNIIVNLDYFQEKIVPELFNRLECFSIKFPFQNYNYHFAEQGEMNLVSHFIQVLSANTNMLITSEYSFDSKSRCDILAYDPYQSTFLLLEAKFHPSIPSAPKTHWPKEESYYDSKMEQLMKYYQALDKQLGKEHAHQLIAGFLVFETAYFNEQNEYLPLWENEKNEIPNDEFYHFKAFKAGEGHNAGIDLVGLACYGKLFNQETFK